MYHRNLVEKIFRMTPISKCLQLISQILVLRDGAFGVRLVGGNLRWAAPLYLFWRADLGSTSAPPFLVPKILSKGAAQMRWIDGMGKNCILSKRIWIMDKFYPVQKVFGQDKFIHLSKFFGYLGQNLSSYPYPMIKIFLTYPIYPVHPVQTNMPTPTPCIRTLTRLTFNKLL